MVRGTSVQIKPRKGGNLSSRRVLLVIGDNPTAQDLNEGRAFGGSVGRQIENQLATALPDHCLVFDYVIPGNREGSDEDVLNLWRRVEKLRPEAILAMGSLSLQAFGLTGSPTDLHGQLLRWRDFIVLASLSPLDCSSQVWSRRFGTIVGQITQYMNRACGWSSQQLIGNRILRFLETPHPFAAIDIETRGLRQDGGRILCVGVAVPDRSKRPRAYWFRFDAHLLKKLQKWMAAGTRVIHNSKYELNWLCPDPLIATNWRIYDTMLAEWCIRSEERLGLEAMMARYQLGVPYHWGGTDKSNLMMTPEVGHCCALDALATLIIARRQLDNVMSPEQEALFYRMGQLAITLFQIERTGTLIDPAATMQQLRAAEREYAKLQKQLADQYGLTNVGSPVQVRKLLFEDLRLPVLEETDTGAPKTDQDVLERLERKTRHPALSMLSRARRLKAKISNVYKPWLELQEGGFLHPDIQVGRVITGRLSCTHPNLQNIERKDRDDPSRGKEWDLFRSRYNGGVILKADFKQFELRITAWLSNCRALLDIFKKGEDPHQATADRAKIDRQTGKQLNLAMCSGTSPAGLAYHWPQHFTKQSAQRLWKKWYELYPEVKRFVEACKTKAASQGFLVNPFGRVRNFDLSGSWQTQAANFNMQSAGADLLYITMIGLQREILKRGLRSRQLVSVHDCLQVDVYPGELEEVKSIIDHVVDTLPCGVKMAMDYSIIKPETR